MWFVAPGSHIGANLTQAILRRLACLKSIVLASTSIPWAKTKLKKREKMNPTSETFMEELATVVHLAAGKRIGWI